MDELNNREYYVARAAVSRQLAHRAANPAIAAIHFDLADRYDQLAQEPNLHDAPVMRINQAV